MVVAARDAASTVARALESVAAQSRLPDHVIVVDDGSRDATAEVARRYGAQVVRTPPSGVSAARNTAIRQSQSDWIAFLDADDWWPAEHLEAALSVLSRTRCEAAVASRVNVTVDGRAFGQVRLTPSHLEVDALLRSNRITLSGVVASRAAVEAAGGFDEDLQFGEDVHLWVRMLANGGRFALTPVPIHYTVRDEPEAPDRLRELERSRALLLDRLRVPLGLDDAALRAAEKATYLDVGLAYSKSGHRGEALRCFARAWPHGRVAPYALFAALPHRAQWALRRAVRGARRARGARGRTRT